MQTALPSSEGVTSYPGPRDKVRRSDLVIDLKVECRMPGQQIGHHLFIGEGVEKLTVFEREVPGILAMAQRVNGEVNGEDEDALIKAAEVAFHRKIDGELAEEYGGRNVNSKPLDVQQARAVRLKSEKGEALNRDEQAVMEARAKVYETTGHSVEGMFHEQNLRGIRPLLNVSFDATATRPNPEEAEVLEFNAKAAAMAGAAVGDATSGSEVAQLRAELAELKASLAGSGKGRK